MIFFMGASLGSFSLVIVRRGHNDDWKSWLTGQSYCETCKKTLKWWELIPTISYLCLGGKCSKCKTKIDPSHFLCETFAGIMYAALFAVYNFGYIDLPKFIFMLVVNSFMIALSASDFLYREINAIPVYVLGAIGCAYNAIFHQSYWNILITVILFIGFGWLCSKDNFVLFGGGDVDVVIAIYALLGSSIWGSLFGVVDVIMYASLAGIVMFFTLYRKSDSSIPFVPCLYFGYFIASFDISVSRAIFDLCQKLFQL
jgi:prepilin signal peptidase PulO-like enzyme (type II secretory pathway)